MEPKDWLQITCLGITALVHL